MMGYVLDVVRGGISVRWIISTPHIASFAHRNELPLVLGGKGGEGGHFGAELAYQWCIIVYSDLTKSITYFCG